MSSLGLSALDDQCRFAASGGSDSPLWESASLVGIPVIVFLSSELELASAVSATCSQTVPSLEY